MQTNLKNCICHLNIDFYGQKISFKVKLEKSLIDLSLIFPMKSSEFEISFSVESFDKKTLLENGRNCYVVKKRGVSKHQFLSRFTSPPNTTSYMKVPDLLSLHPSLTFPFHLLPSPVYPTGLPFYIFSGFLAVFTLLSSTVVNNMHRR